MNLSKSEMKMAVAQDIGKQFAEREDALSAEVRKLEGAQAGLKQASDKLESVKAFYQKEVNDGGFEEANLEMVMKAIDRCKGVLFNLAELAQAQKLVKQGEAQEAKKSMDLIEKIFTDEKLRVESVLKAIEDGEVPDAGEVRPVNSAAADLAARRAAARAEKEAKAGETQETAPEPAQAAPEAVPEAPVAPVAAAPEPEAAETPPAQEAPPPPEPRASLPTPRRQMIQRRKK